MTAPIATRHVQDMITDVERSFGDESHVQLKTADTIRWINSGQIEIINKNPILKSISVTPGLKDQTEFSIPADCIQMEMVKVDTIFLRACSWEEIKDVTLAGPQSGQAQIWAIYANKIFIYPGLDKDQNITIYYAKRPTDVTSAGDLLSIPDRYYDRLKEYVMSRAYEMDEDWTAHQVQRDQFESNLLALTNADANVQGPYLIAMDTEYEESW